MDNFSSATSIQVSSAKYTKIVAFGTMPYPLYIAFSPSSSPSGGKILWCGTAAFESQSLPQTARATVSVWCDNGIERCFRPRRNGLKSEAEESRASLRFPFECSPLHDRRPGWKDGTASYVVSGSTSFIAAGCRSFIVVSIVSHVEQFRVHYAPVVSRSWAGRDHHQPVLQTGVLALAGCVA